MNVTMLSGSSKGTNKRVKALQDLLLLFHLAERIPSWNTGMLIVTAFLSIAQK